MKLVLASHNKKKINELGALLSKSGISGIELATLDDIGFTDEIIEDGSSFEENAMIKARAAAAPGRISVADDSGLCVDTLGGSPGIYSARYSGENATDAKNNEKLLRELEGAADRSAKFVACIACVLPDGESFTVRGECPGIILEAPRGCDGFGYDPLFYIPSAGQTFAELPPDKKNAISHRGVAMREFAARLREYLA